MKEYLIDEKLEGIRLDKCVVSLDTDLSRETAQRLIEEGNISINDKKSKASYKVSIGDKISINKPEPKETNIVPQDIPIEILYEDEDIIVVNKPKGLVVTLQTGNPDGTLVNAIMNICKDSLSGIGGEIRPRNNT